MTRYFTWDSANSNGTSNLAFTNSNRTVTKFGGNGVAYRSGRSLETIPSNEDNDAAITLSGLATSIGAGDVLIGFCNATQAFATGTYMGGPGQNSVSLDTAGGRNYGGSATASGLGAMSGAGQVVLLRWRLSTGNAVDWSINGGANWYTFSLAATPLTGTTLYLCYTTRTDNDAWTTDAAPVVGGSSSTALLMGV